MTCKARNESCECLDLFDKGYLLKFSPMIKHGIGKRADGISELSLFNYHYRSGRICEIKKARIRVISIFKMWRQI